MEKKPIYEVSFTTDVGKFTKVVTFAPSDWDAITFARFDLQLDNVDLSNLVKIEVIKRGEK